MGWVWEIEFFPFLNIYYSNSTFNGQVNRQTPYTPNIHSFYLIHLFHAKKINKDEKKIDPIINVVNLGNKS